MLRPDNTSVLKYTIPHLETVAGEATAKSYTCIYYK